MSSKSRQQLESYLKTVIVPDDLRILDIGGSQNPILNRIQPTTPKDYKILDLPQPHEVKLMPDIPVDICIPLKINGEPFDVVFCIEVAEYFSDPVTALRNINMLTRMRGTLIMSFQFVYPVHNPQGCDFFRYTPFGAEMLLERAGFEIVDCFTRTGESVPICYATERMKAAKDFPDHDAVAFVYTAIKKIELNT